MGGTPDGGGEALADPEAPEGSRGGRVVPKDGGEEGVQERREGDPGRAGLRDPAIPPDGRIGGRRWDCCGTCVAVYGLG